VPVATQVLQNIKHHQKTKHNGTLFNIVHSHCPDKISDPLKKLFRDKIFSKNEIFENDVSFCLI